MPILNCPIRSQAINSPNDIAIYLANKKISYLQLDTLIEDVAKQLLKQNINTGDAIACCDDNSLTIIVSLFAAIRIGAIFCPLSHRYTTIEKQQLLHHTGINYLWQHSGEAIANTTLLDIKIKSLRNLNDSVNLHQTSLSPIELKAEQPVSIIFTSGSVGKPKGVVHSLSNHYYSALGSQNIIPLNKTSCWLASLPFNHIGGLAIIMRCFFSGASIALVYRKNLMTSLTKYPISHASLVPTQLHTLLKELSADSMSLPLQYLLLGGAPCNEKLLAQVSTLGFNVFYSYGLTEMCSQVATTNTNDKYFSAPLPFREWKLENGEIAVKGETLFLGYWVAGSINECQQENWFFTKDLGELNAKGLKIIGRKDNMFICGGENYQPETIENIIAECPYVISALIVGIEDEVYGTIPVAFICWKDGEIKIPQLKNYLKLQISNIECPKHFLPWPESTLQALKHNRNWFKRQVNLNHHGK